MEVDHQGESNGDAVGHGVGIFSSCWRRICSLPGRVGSSVAGFAKKLVSLAKEEPKRVAHSIKVGVALALVSLLYYVDPLFNGGFGINTMWAVLTVVVVMQYTVGATLSKGLNRTFATLLAGSIALGVHKLAEIAEDSWVQGEPILLTLFVFFIASTATFSRFIPEIKTKYDYGVNIFILTFCLVAVSSFRVHEIIQLAHQRFYTIVIGVAICLCTTIFLFPVWAGEDLHKLAAGNLDKLAQFLQGLESECFGDNTVSENLDGKDFLQVYKSVINSKGKEDSLSTFANWEPHHGKFRFRHPWSKYQKLGDLCRQCASTMEALASYVITIRKCQYPETNPELSLKIRTACGEMSSRSAKVFKDLSTAMRTMTKPSPAGIAMSTAIEAAEGFRTELSQDGALVQVMHLAVAASILSNLVTQTKEIAECVDKIARHAHFKNAKKAQNDVVINIVSLQRGEPRSDGLTGCEE